MDSSNYIILPKVKKRVKAYSKFIDVAYELYKLNNFSCAIAITSGINNSAVYRLKFTKEKVTNLAKFEELTWLVEASHAHKNYREAIQKSVGPCIPHLGVFLQDITFIEDGNEDMLDNGKLINFHKRRMVSKIILIIRQFQQSPYNFQYVEVIQDFIKDELNKTSKMGDAELFDISLIVEPRDANVVD